MKKVNKLLALCAGLTVTTLAFAETEVKQQEEDKVIVSYIAADAATEKGRRELERKIRRAAISVCGPLDLRGVGSMGQLRVNRTCFNNAVEKALRDISTLS